ncbi:MAG: hypothetical protein LEGION0398_MBIBDBAK_00439 [Legionellaceae bacterium]
MGKHMQTSSKMMLISTFFIILLYTYFYQIVDRSIALEIYQGINPHLRTICSFISSIGTPIFWTIACLTGFFFFIICYLINKIPPFSYRIFYLSSSIFLAQILGAIIKYSIGRARPILFLQQHIYGFHPFSFTKAYDSTPSGHTLCLFALAYMTAFYYRRWSYILFMIAISVGISRILLSQHYVSDVLLGGYIGMFSAFITQQILQKNTISLNRI